jgi:hypothetical protein
MSAVDSQSDASGKRIGKRTNASGLGSLIQQTFDITADRTCAFVNERISRLMVEESRNSHPLLLTTRQNILPIFARIPATLSIRQIA